MHVFGFIFLPLPPWIALCFVPDGASGPHSTIHPFSVSVTCIFQSYIPSTSTRPTSRAVVPEQKICAPFWGFLWPCWEEEEKGSVSIHFCKIQWNGSGVMEVTGTSRDYRGCKKAVVISGLLPTSLTSCSFGKNICKRLHMFIAKGTPITKNLDNHLLVNTKYMVPCYMLLLCANFKQL